MLMGSDAAMTLTDLPLECLAHALRFLPAADVSSAMASCATLRDVGGSETMWRWLSWRDFGIVPPPGLIGGGFGTSVGAFMV